MLIEDDHFFENFYAEKLKESGFSVELAVDGQDGMEKLKTVHPDLILLDLIMPKKDGFQVLAELAADPALKTIPVMVFSTLGQENDIARAKALGARDYVNKTFFDFDNLLAKISELTKK